MNRCPITYLPCGDAKYSAQGLRMLHPKLQGLFDFPYTAPEQRREAAGRAGKMSIQGVQPKLGARLDSRNQVFEVVHSGGIFIIKPQHDAYLQMPENEDLTMKMAAATGIETPVHGLVWCKDGSLSYFIRRFDRAAKNTKLAVEDFAQLTGKPREEKYDFTIEKMAKVIEQHCTFPMLEKRKFFRLVLFCFLTGNEDMHLKNFSLITRQGKVEFSPAYDLLNTTLAMGSAQEEMALLLAGKRKEFGWRELVDYFGLENLALSPAALAGVLSGFEAARPRWEALIAHSFLSADLQQNYLEMLDERFRRLRV